jgi:predicted kinase
LRAGWSVVVDAAFLKRAERDAFRALARALGVPFAILAPVAEPDQLRARIQARQAQGHDASEATVEVLEQQMQWIEPLEPDERALLLEPSGGA